MCLREGGTIINVHPDESSAAAPVRELGSFGSTSKSEAISDIIDNVLPKPIGSAMMPP